MGALTLFHTQHPPSSGQAWTAPSIPGLDSTVSFGPQGGGRRGGVESQGSTWGRKLIPTTKHSTLSMAAPSSDSHTWFSLTVCQLLITQTSRRVFSFKLSKMTPLAFAQEWHFSMPYILGFLVVCLLWLLKRQGMGWGLSFGGKGSSRQSMAHKGRLQPHAIALLAIPAEGPDARTLHRQHQEPLWPSGLGFTLWLYLCHITPSQAGSHWQWCVSSSHCLLCQWIFDSAKLT